MYSEGNYWGYLYYVSHYFSNGQVIATYQGILCLGTHP